MTHENQTQPLPVTDDTQVLPAPADTGPAEPLAPPEQLEPREPSRPAEPADVAAGTSRPLVRTGPRTGTIVWGLLILAAGVGLLAQAAGASIDLELAAIVLMGAAGALLVVGSLVSGARRRRAEARA